MLITDERLRKLVEDEEIISPFDEEKLQSESYDVTIGEKVIKFSKEVRCLDIAFEGDFLNLNEEEDIEKDGYVISPKEFILIPLAETFKIPANLAAHIRPKTTYTRIGLLVSPQHCNSTYEGRLQIGVFNASNCPIRIRSGYPIAQIVFEELDKEASSNKQYKNKENAHYQNENGSIRTSKFNEKYLNNVMEQILKTC